MVFLLVKGNKSPDGKVLSARCVESGQVPVLCYSFRSSYAIEGAVIIGESVPPAGSRVGGD